MVCRVNVINTVKKCLFTLQAYVTVDIYSKWIHIYSLLPNRARMDWGASERAMAESVGPRASLHWDTQFSPINSNAITGPLVTKFRRVLKKKKQRSKLHKIWIFSASHFKYMYLYTYSLKSSIWADTIQFLVLIWFLVTEADNNSIFKGKY